MIEIKQNSAYSKTHEKRFHKTLEFMEGLDLKSSKILNLGPTNPLSDFLEENGYDITDPKNDESLQSVLRPVFLAADQKEREELFETIQTCADENNIPLGGTADFENPEEVADTLDTELEFAQCLREKGIEVEDPNAERPLRSILISLVQSGQYLEDQIRETAGECFDDLGLEPPQQGGG